MNKKRIKRLKKLANEYETAKIAGEKAATLVKSLKEELDKLQEELTFTITRRKQSYHYSLPIAQILPTGELRSFLSPNGYWSESTDLSLEESKEYAEWLKSCF